MAFIPSTKSRILLGDFYLASYTTDVGFSAPTEMLDTTVLTDTAKQFIPGQDTSTVTLSGHHDVLAYTDNTAFKAQTTPTPFSYAPSGFGVGSEVALINAIDAGYELSAPVNGVVDWSINIQTTGRTDVGVSLADLAAITADGNGTAVNGSAATTSGAAAHLHVTAFSGFSGVVVTIEDSANGSSGWATIGTFTTVAAVTGERIEIAGTVRQYVRAVFDVTGTGSVTAQVSLARR